MNGSRSVIQFNAGGEQLDQLMRRLTLRTDDGSQVALTDLVDVSLTASPLQLLSLNGTPAVLICGHGPVGADAEEVAESLDRIVNEVHAELGLSDDFVARQLSGND